MNHQDTKFRIIVGLIASAMFASISLAQADEQPVITAENVAQMSSVLQLNFADIEDLTPGSGLFVINEDATTAISFGNVAGEPPLSTALIWDGITGELIDTLPIGDNTYDRVLREDRLLVAGVEGITSFDLSEGTSELVLPANEVDPYLEVWLDPEGNACGETSAALIFCEGWDQPITLFNGDAMEFARIGRVPPPFAVTSSEDGLVQRWNMLSNTVTAEAEVGEIAVFGAINSGGSHLAWRDPMSTTLYLLDFATGENRKIADLSGGYIAYLLLSRDADVIFGIDPAAGRGEIWAWLTVTGEKINLGRFRTCERQQPALAELSADGTTLVIGCDLGLDLWRIDVP